MKMATVWPALPPEYALVLRERGAGHAASFGFFCAILWLWPVVLAVSFLRAYVRRRGEIMPVSPKEIGQFAIWLPIAVLIQVFDTTKATNSPYAFYADSFGFFYLRQWLAFSLMAAALGVLVFVVGRWAANWVFAGE